MRVSAGDRVDPRSACADMNTKINRYTPLWHEQKGYRVFWGIGSGGERGARVPEDRRHGVMTIAVGDREVGGLSTAAGGFGRCRVGFYRGVPGAITGDMQDLIPGVLKDVV